MVTSLLEVVKFPTSAYFLAWRCLFKPFPPWRQLSGLVTSPSRSTTQTFFPSPTLSCFHQSGLPHSEGEAKGIPLAAPRVLSGPIWPQCSLGFPACPEGQQHSGSAFVFAPLSRDAQTPSSVNKEAQREPEMTRVRGGETARGTSHSMWESWHCRSRERRTNSSKEEKVTCL